MSTFGDYKSYKKYEPAYSNWKNKRDLAEARRDAYLNKHPELINDSDIQRGKILLRAIDVMDEYSQKKAENMEAATEPIISMGLELTALAGMGIGGLLGSIKPIGKFFAKIANVSSKYSKLAGIGIPATIGLVAGTFAAFPFMAWGARAEVSASRKGRFEAMRNELKNPKGFAILNEEQMQNALDISQTVVLEEDKKKSLTNKISGGFSALKDMAMDSKEYKQQKRQFQIELMNDEANIDKELSEEETLAAKRDQQLLTKLVEKIDIASQDYAENSELATQTAILGVGAAGGLLSICTEKVLKAMNVKSAEKIGAITKILSITAFMLMGIFAAEINKHASRVGRYKIKQELMQNPNNFVYVDDEKANEITDAKVKPTKKQNIFSFLINAWKDNREYNKYKKNAAKNEKRLFKAMEEIELSPEQIKAAKQLQKNTFRTFNKIDENSQKYAESIEALGQAIAYPINSACSIIAAVVATPYLFKDAKTNIEKAQNYSKYFGIIALSLIPAVIINALITKEQKKASRIADMKTIEELNDYRKFA